MDGRGRGEGDGGVKKKREWVLVVEKYEGSELRDVVWDNKGKEWQGSSAMEVV